MRNHPGQQQGPDVAAPEPRWDRADAQWSRGGAWRENFWAHTEGEGLLCPRQRVGSWGRWLLQPLGNPASLDLRILHM